LCRRPPPDVEGTRSSVLAGRHTTMSCWRRSHRLNGASVRCAYRRAEASMPGARKELVNGREQGVEFQFKVQPQY
ncbi:oxidoreductase (Fe-S)-binding subunit, partial [Escherichia coli]|nr:oxidoreductase (Fe-S)-binding subunit [Escherichia coli]